MKKFSSNGFGLRKIRRNKSGLRLVGIFSSRKERVCQLPWFLRKLCCGEEERIIHRGDRYIRFLYDPCASYMGGFSPKRAEIYPIKLCCYQRLLKTRQWPIMESMPGYKDTDSQQEIRFDLEL